MNLPRISWKFHQKVEIYATQLEITTIRNHWMPFFEPKPLCDFLCIFLLKGTWGVSFIIIFIKCLRFWFSELVGSHFCICLEIIWSDCTYIYNYVYIYNYIYNIFYVLCFQRSFIFDVSRFRSQVTEDLSHCSWPKWTPVSIWSLAWHDARSLRDLTWPSMWLTIKPVVEQRLGSDWTIEFML